MFVKSDGNYTYLVPDIPYHIDKLERGYDKLIDVLGTDHHGYVARLKSALKAFEYDENKLDVKRIPKDELPALIKQLSSEMQLAAANLEFERAALLRDEIEKIKAYMEGR